MNPVDNSTGVRPQRSELDQDSGRAGNVRGTGESGAAAAASSERPAEGESVTLTRTASELLQLEESLQALPGVDQARVNSIREAIADGSYSINPTSIVDSLLQSESELG